MALAFILIAVFLVAKWLIEAVIMRLFGNKKETDNNTSPHIHYHITNNHLHVNEDEYNRLKK